MRIIAVVVLTALAQAVSGCNFTDCEKKLEVLRNFARDKYFPVFVDSIYPRMYDQFVFGTGLPATDQTLLTLNGTNKERLDLLNLQLQRPPPVEDLVCGSGSPVFGIPGIGWFPNLALCAILDRKRPSDFTDEAVVDEIMELLQFALDHKNDDVQVQLLAHTTLGGYQNFDGNTGYALIHNIDLYNGRFEKSGASENEVKRAKLMADKLKGRLTNWKPSEFYNRMFTCTFSDRPTIVTPLTVARGEYVHRVGMFKFLNGREFVPLEGLTGGDFDTFKIKASFANASWYNLVRWIKPVVKQNGLILASPFADHVKFQGFDIMVHRIECGNYALFVEERIEMDWRERLFPCNKFIFEKYYDELKAVVTAEEISQKVNFKGTAESKDVDKYRNDPIGVLKKVVADQLVVTQTHVDGVNHTVNVVMANISGETELVGVPLEALKRVVQDPQNQKYILGNVSRVRAFGEAVPGVGAPQFRSLKLTGYVHGGGPLLHDDQDWREAVKKARVVLPIFDCTNKRNAKEARSCITTESGNVFKFLKHAYGYFKGNDEKLCEDLYKKSYKTEGVDRASINLNHWAREIRGDADKLKYVSQRELDLEAEARAEEQKRKEEERQRKEKEEQAERDKTSTAKPRPPSPSPPPPPSPPSPPRFPPDRKCLVSIGVCPWR